MTPLEVAHAPPRGSQATVSEPLKPMSFKKYTVHILVYELIKTTSATLYIPFYFGWLVICNFVPLTTILIKDLSWVLRALKLFDTNFSQELGESGSSFSSSYDGNYDANQAI